MLAKPAIVFNSCSLVRRQIVEHRIWKSAGASIICVTALADGSKSLMLTNSEQILCIRVV
jgi:hypothetical protein